jgi:hypothetical protein
MDQWKYLDGAGTVLLVEPHTPSRLTLRSALAQQGYRVMQAEGGRRKRRPKGWRRLHTC